jgi:hypothetical protein
LGLSEDVAKSADAIINSKKGLVLIEFKNGSVNNRDVKDKVRDSVLILCDIIKCNISYIRENIDFILVYNETKNPLPKQIIKGIVQESHSRTFISKKLAQKGKQEFVLFDLDRYKKFLFKEVHTYTQEEFEEYLEKNHVS